MFYVLDKRPTYGKIETNNVVNKLGKHDLSDTLKKERKDKQTRTIKSTHTHYTTQRTGNFGAHFAHIQGV